MDRVSDPGHPDRPNEDRCGQNGAFAWVIDGATGLGDTPLLSAPSDAAWLATVLHEAFCEAADQATSPAALLTLAADVAARRFVAERHRAPDHRYEIPTASVMLAHFGDDGVHMAELGDCAAHMRTGEQRVRYGGAAAGRERERQNARRLMAEGLPMGVGKGRSPQLLAFLRDVRNRANAPGGYRVISPEPESAAPARCHHHRAVAGEALLLTDGYEAAIDDYGLYTAASLMDESATLATPLAALRAVERDDPLCQRHPRFKPSDDATALFLRYGAVQV
ncbi:MAG: hypothetical protein AAGD34_09750 [Pseudomonadota bacterium]